MHPCCRLPPRRRALPGRPRGRECRSKPLERMGHSKSRSRYFHLLPFWHTNFLEKIPVAFLFSRKLLFHLFSRENSCYDTFLEKIPVTIFFLEKVHVAVIFSRKFLLHLFSRENSCISKMHFFGRCLIVAFRMCLRLQSPKIRNFRDRREERTQKQSREFERTREKSRRKIDRNFLEKKN